MNKTYEKYPWSIILASILLQLAIYVIAGIIIFQFGLTWFFLYLVYVIILELSFYPRACVYCYYYGKWCAFGKGKIAGWFFEKKDSQKFCEREAKFINMLPEMLVVIVPVILGIVLLIIDFSFYFLILIVSDLILVSKGNAWVRGKACPHCKQGQICCPANKMFGKKK